jgi:cytidylate kinase
MGPAEGNHGVEEDLPVPAEELEESPHHGFRGHGVPSPKMPRSLTIAVSREAGARGYTIGARAGLKLGWPVYNQELLEYVAQEGAFQQEMADHFSPEAFPWAEEQLEKLLREQNVSRHPSVLELARLVLALGAEGEVVLIGRGAGCILPRESTLNVRIIAPLEDRVAYMSQWLRLTREEAAEQVRLRDTRRAEFLTTHFHRQPGQIHHYDLLLNSSFLGEDVCAELIAQAARAKLAAWSKPRNMPPGEEEAATD